MERGRAERRDGDGRSGGKGVGGGGAVRLHGVVGWRVGEGDVSQMKRWERRMWMING